MSQRIFFITLLGSLITLGGVNHVALAQPVTDDVVLGTYSAYKDPTGIPLNIKVLAPNHIPLAQQTIQILLDGEHTASGWDKAVTDQQGVLSGFKGFQPDVYAIYIHAPGIGSGYFKGINVHTGGPIISLQLQTGGTLRVIAYEAGSSKPIGGAEVMLQRFPAVPTTGNIGNRIPLNQMPLIAGRQPTRDGDGSLEISNVLPGRYKLLAYGAPGYKSNTTEFVMTEGAVVPLNLHLTPDALPSLTVVIRDAQGNLLPNLDINLSFAPLNKEEEPVTGMASRRIHTDTKGEAVLFPVKSGRWSISASGKVTVKETEFEITSEGGTVSLIAKMN